jgi:hypothetical protein
MNRPTIIEALEDTDLLGCLEMSGDSWGTWHVILKAAYGLPLDSDELPIFTEITGLSEYNPPDGGWRRVVIIAGRQSGKSSVIGAVVDYDSLFPLVEGANLRAVLVAQDQEALKSVLFSYAKRPFENGPLEDSLDGKITSVTIPLDNGVTIRAYPCSSKAIRGPRAIGVYLDEFAFYRSSSGEPLEKKVSDAARYSLLTTGGKTWIISSPYDEGSELHRLYEQHYGKANETTIVFQAPTELLNPTISEATLDAIRSEDPDAAAAELDAQFRKGLSKLFDMANVQACVDIGRTERAPMDGVKYVGFVDAASGTRAGLDRYTIGVGHMDKGLGRVVIDTVRVWHPPFNPQTVTAEAAAIFRAYGIVKVHGDKLALGYVGAEFAGHRILYEPTEGTDQTASAMILNLLPGVNANQISLLDQADVLAEFKTIDRVLTSGGVQKTSHPRGTHDDALVAIAGVFKFGYRKLTSQAAVGAVRVTTAERAQAYFENKGRPTGMSPQYAPSGHPIKRDGSIMVNGERYFDPRGY